MKEFIVSFAVKDRNGYGWGCSKVSFFFWGFYGMKLLGNINFFNYFFNSNVRILSWVIFRIILEKGRLVV